MATIYDIARATGVTQTTVANALAGRGNVSEATRKRILQCAEEIGYRPNEIARNFKRRKTMMLAFILPTIANPYYPEIAEEVERCAQSSDYQMLFMQYSLRRRAGQSSPGATCQSLGRWSHHHGVQHEAGNHPHSLSSWASRRALQLAGKRAASRRYPSSRGRLSCRRCTGGANICLDLGHRDLAIIVDLPQQIARLEGFRSALEDAGIALPEHRIMHGDSTLESGNLVLASHASLRDNYAVSIAELDIVVEIATRAPGALGARMVGAGFGGAVLDSCPRRSARRASGLGWQPTIPLEPGERRRSIVSSRPEDRGI